MGQILQFGEFEVGQGSVQIGNNFRFESRSHCKYLQ
jgi:hypothetical protein